MLKSIRLMSVLGIGFVFLTTGVMAGDWPRFLGPGDNAKADQGDAKGFWKGESLEKMWEFPKGKGWACPAVVGPRVIVFHRIQGEEVLDCLDVTSGKVLWHLAYQAPYRDRYGSSDGPRSSPVVSGSRVFSFGVTGLLHCVDLQSGEVKWKRDLSKDYAMKPNFFGHGGTPLIIDGRVIVPIGGTEDRCVVALDEQSGKELWIASHPWGAGYASPVAATTGAKREGKPRGLVFAGGESRPPTGGLLCIELETGKVLGEMPHRSKIAESVNAASPLVVGSTVFTTEAYGSGGVMSEIQGDGSLRKLWGTSKLGSQFMTPLEKDGFIFGFDGQNPQLAELVCLDAKTGEQKWRDDLGGKVGRANLVDLGESGLLALGEFGELLRLKVDASGAKVEQRLRLFDAPETWTMPVLAGGRLFVTQNEPGRDRSPARVICFGK
ncbi:MAG: PQQ-binding-like beta-propeller repeat protein [Verrucomicrobiota bacterium]